MKNYISSGRAKFVTQNAPWVCSPAFMELEAEYGHVLLQQFDMEPVVANDMERFMAWYREAAAPIEKLEPDIAGIPRPDGLPLFRSVNNMDLTGRSIWNKNYRADLFTEFPELYDKIMQFPFDRMPELSLWESIRDVVVHRDEYMYADLPCSFRSLMYDENPAPSLYLYDDPQRGLPRGEKMYYSNPPESNSFGWNNLRIKHGSTFHGHTKILLIVSPLERFNLRKYRDLLERSAKKYPPVTTENKKSDYVLF